MCYYTNDGIQDKKYPVLFDTNALSKFTIVKDRHRDDFYLYDKRRAKNKLYKINQYDGTLTRMPIILEKPNAENIQISGGNIYYLWQDDATTRKLYVQRNSIP